MTNPTPLAHGAMPELPELLRNFARAVERIAFEMPAPNPYTPRLVQMTTEVFSELNRRAAIQQAAVAVPEGMRLVPIEPTPAMLEASLRVFEWGWVEPCPELLECGVPVEMGITQEEAGHINAENMKEQAKIYAAMLAAAPQPDTGDSVHLGGGECGGVTQPLTDEQIARIHQSTDWSVWGSGIRFARAIEAAHGINPGSAPREDGHG